MTISECLTIMAALKQSRIPEEQLCRYLYELDGRLYNSLFAGRACTFTVPTVPYTPMDGERELLVKAPYAAIYEAYLSLQEDILCGEISRSNNDALRYNAILDDLAAYVGRTFPVKTCTAIETGLHI